MLNGCVAKNEFETKSKTKTKTNVMVVVNKVKSKNTWKKVSPSKKFTINTKNTKKEDCIDCYATDIDYSKPPSASNNALIKTPKKPLNTKNFGGYDYIETVSDTTVKNNTYNSNNKYVVPVVEYVNTSYGAYSGNTAIQVGAFRQYDGAQKYMKRYSVLSSKYKAAIKKGTKNNKPLYRVRIEGFKNKAEAKKFMHNYGIRDAFIVIK